MINEKAISDMWIDDNAAILENLFKIRKNNLGKKNIRFTQKQTKDFITYLLITMDLSNSALGFTFENFYRDFMMFYPYAYIIKYERLNENVMSNFGLYGEPYIFKDRIEKFGKNIFEKYKNNYYKDIDFSKVDFDEWPKIIKEKGAYGFIMYYMDLYRKFGLIPISYYENYKTIFRRIIPKDYMKDYFIKSYNFYKKYRNHIIRKKYATLDNIKLNKQESKEALDVIDSLYTYYQKYSYEAIEKIYDGILKIKNEKYSRGDLLELAKYINIADHLFSLQDEPEYIFKYIRLFHLDDICKKLGNELSIEEILNFKNIVNILRGGADNLGMYLDIHIGISF